LRRLRLIGIYCGVAACASSSAAAAAPAIRDTEAIAIARGTGAVQRALAARTAVQPAVVHTPTGGLEVRWLDNRGQGVAVVIGPSHRVQRVWTGYQAQWELARGTPGGVGGLAAALWVWIPLSIAFVIPFADLRRPFSLRNADLAALLGLSASFAFFNHGNLGLSVPLVYPPLLYLCCRLLSIGRRRARGGALQPNVPLAWLAWALVPLLVLRVVLAFASRFELDVAALGVAGADTFAHWRPFYGHSLILNGDHYGPVVYWLSVPFEALWSFTPRSDTTGTHWANVTFDLLLVAVLYALGTRIGGRRLGVVVTYGWLTLPLGLLALCSGSNDGLVALLVVAALLALSRPALAGALAAMAALTKVAPALVVPLLATHPGVALPATRRRAMLFTAGLAAAATVLLATVFVHTSPSMFWDRAVTAELNRDSPLSIWGFYDPTAHSQWLYVAQTLVRAGALALALAVTIRPRQRDMVQLAALGAAVLIALELASSYWIYLYATWFLPLALVAFLAPFGALAGPASWRCRPLRPARPRRARPRSRVSASGPS
jgi:hypothetical protein